MSDYTDPFEAVKQHRAAELAEALAARTCVEPDCSRPARVTSRRCLRCAGNEAVPPPRGEGEQG